MSAPYCVLFSDSAGGLQTFCTLIDRSIMRASFYNFPALYEFPMVFSVKRTENTDRAGRNVRLVSELVQILRGALRWACPLPPKIG